MENDFSKNLCWVSYIHPYTFVIPDDEKPWEVPLKEINSVSYNVGNLMRIVCKIKTDNNELDALVCYDGAIAIARNGKYYKKEEAVKFFNSLFSKLIFSGFYVEGIDSRDVVSGILHNRWGIYVTEFGSSAPSQLHSKIRAGMVNNIDSIYLSGPRVLKINLLNQMIENGNSILKKIPNLTPKFLNNGITEIRYRNWDLVLSNLWIISEQLIDYLWHNDFLSNYNNHPKDEINGRKKSLKDDSRTWSMAVKQEILFQNKVISEIVLSRLYNSRKARNKLVHEGKDVQRQIAFELFKAVQELLRNITGDETLLAKEIFLEDKVFLNSNKNGDEKFDDSIYEDWRNLPDENIVENILGEYVTKRLKLSNPSEQK
ncbi:hypothetical protein ACLI08_10135 [Flavobacterium sp. RNTU_13]|uniref:hypothetical protein n=1 Tax=Flavobacterium sp. RNTU_13 TaxID=3375145 RepID=UPI003985795A